MVVECFSLLDKKYNEKKLNFILKDKENMIFFPVENSLGKNKNNEKHLAPLKQAIHATLTDADSSGNLHGMNKKIFFILDIYQGLFHQREPIPYVLGVDVCSLQTSRSLKRRNRKHVEVLY